MSSQTSKLQTIMGRVFSKTPTTPKKQVAQNRVHGDNSQHSRIIKLLKQRPVHGVPNYVFPQHNILCYSKRISELRRDGYHITGERQVVNGRHSGVWIYKLVEEA